MISFFEKYQKLCIILLTACFLAMAVGLALFAVSLDGREPQEESHTESSATETVSQTPSVPVQSEETEQSEIGLPEASQEESEESSAVSEEVSDEPEPEPWNLILVNGKNPIPEGYEVQLAEVENGHKVDHRIADALTQMLADARADGILPRITSSFRTDEDQRAILQEYIDDYLAQGYTQEEAEAEARNWAALPGTSEHQIGLAVDISTADWNKQSAYIVWEWLENNCTRYGFILRYTEEWASITGTSPEPWHFRYVGVEAAEEITAMGVCLEEYLGAE